MDIETNRMNIDRYKDISNLGESFDNIRINSHIPSPTDKQYKIGYIIRYFIQKVNDRNAPIFEITSNSVSKFSNSAFYKTTSLDWRLNGTPEQIKKSNAASVKLASADIPKIGLYLPNLLQFHKK